MASDRSIRVEKKTAIDLCAWNKTEFGTSASETSEVMHGCLEQQGEMSRHRKGEKDWLRRESLTTVYGML